MSWTGRGAALLLTVETMAKVPSSICTAGIEGFSFSSAGDDPV
jgi:hypothetical protein